MQTLSPQRYTREEVNNDVLSFAVCEAAFNGGVVEFIDYDIQTDEWLIVFRYFDK